MPPTIMRRSQNSGISKFSLPEVAPKGNNVLPPISSTGLGMMGTYELKHFYKTLFSIIKEHRIKVSQITSKNEFLDNFLE